MPGDGPGTTWPAKWKTISFPAWSKRLARLERIPEGDETLAEDPGRDKVTGKANSEEASSQGVAANVDWSASDHTRPQRLRCVLRLRNQAGRRHSWRRARWADSILGVCRARV